MDARVLLVVASRHGATREIADTAADVLRERGAVVDVAAPGEAPGVTGYDAVIVGSAVYTGHWLPAARAYVERESRALATRHVWFFSSGLAGQPAAAANSPHEIAAMVTSVGAHGHRSFRGRLDVSVLSFAERAIIAGARARAGDHRDLAAVRRWADEVGDELVRVSALSA